MIIKNVTQVGNKVIRSRAKEVRDVLSKETKRAIKDLVDSMRHHELVGMAGPQIGAGLRIFVSEIRVTKLRKGQGVSNADKLRVYVNPKITWQSKEKVAGYEGCGSVVSANLFGMIERPKSVVVEALDENGKPFKLKAENLLARVIQHEFDHIEGKVFTDSTDPATYMSRDEYINKFKK